LIEIRKDRLRQIQEDSGRRKHFEFFFGKTSSLFKSLNCFFHEKQKEKYDLIS
jgi:hypothetical protein